MSETVESQRNDLYARFRQTYTAAIADVLDQRGHRNQILDGAIQGLTMGMRIAGPVFTCKGAAATELEEDDWDMRKAFLDAIPDQAIAVIAGTGDGTAAHAHWGELMARAARGRGCTGAVIDGGTRDVSKLLEMDFPTFCRFRSPASSILRWRISGFDQPVYCGGVLVRSGDIIVGDADGVVVVPATLAKQVLETVESLAGKETAMREDLLAGAWFSETFDRYQVG